jgi:hypothetical protein
MKSASEVMVQVLGYPLSFMPFLLAIVRKSPTNSTNLQIQNELNGLQELLLPKPCPK